MEHFFDALATVMSNQLRGAVQEALNDFMTMLEQYNNGNSYTGEYKRGLPTVKNAIIIGLVGTAQYFSNTHYHFFLFYLDKWLC